MAVTGTSALSDIVHAAYERDFMNAWEAGIVWFKHVWWRGASGTPMTMGSTINFPVAERLARATSNLTETSDVTPVAANASEVGVTIVEKGNAVQKTFLLEETSYPDNGQMIAGQVAENQSESLDIYTRDQVLGNTLVYRPAGCAARTDVDATNDKPGYDDIVHMTELARGMEVPSYDDGSYVSIVHPSGIAMIRQISEVVALAEYAEPGLIYSGKPGGLLGDGARFPGEVFRINNLRFISHPFGKVYLSGGTTAQAATTLNGAVSAGATSVIVASATGLAAGNFITLGTLEAATSEQVEITEVNGTTLTIRGAGNSYDNWGCKYAHANGAAVTEAANVFAAPVLGPRSIVGYYDTKLGMEGVQDVHPHQGVINNRFFDYTWHWAGGVAKVDKNIIRGEFASSIGLYGNN